MVDPKQPAIIQIARLCRAIADGLVDPRSVDWAHIAAISERASIAPGSAEAFREWMTINGFTRLNAAAAEINQRLYRATGTAGRYTGSELGMWRDGKRPVPKKLKPIIWPEGEG